MRGLVVLLASTPVFGLLGACSGAHEARHESISTTETSFNDAPRLDVAALLRLTIDEVASRVGPPHRVPPVFQDPTLIAQPQSGGSADSTVLFQYRGLNLVVSYDHGTRQVKDLLMLGNNEDELMSRGKLQLGSSHYLVLPVFQRRHPTELMGLRVLASDNR